MKKYRSFLNNIIISSIVILALAQYCYSYSLDLVRGFPSYQGENGIFVGAIGSAYNYDLNNMWLLSNENDPYYYNAPEALGRASVTNYSYYSNNNYVQNITMSVQNPVYPEFYVPGSYPYPPDYYLPMDYCYDVGMYVVIPEANNYIIRGHFDASGFGGIGDPQTIYTSELIILINNSVVWKNGITINQPYYSFDVYLNKGDTIGFFAKGFIDMTSTGIPMVIDDIYYPWYITYGGGNLDGMIGDSSVPEPSTLCLLLGGLGVFVIIRRTNQ